MHFELEKCKPETRSRIEALMKNNGWSLNKAINEITAEGIGSGGLSEVGKKKAPVLSLVDRLRDSERASGG